MLRFSCFLILLTCFSSFACAQRYKGSGDLVKQERSVRDFDGLKFSSAIKVDVVQGDDYSVVVEADDNIIDRVLTEVRGSRLVLSLDGNSFNNVTIRINITMPSLTQIVGSGATRATISGFNENSMEVKVSGASHLSFSNSSVGDLELDAAGASNVDLKDLRAQTADIDVAGASSVKLHVEKEVEGDVSGASSVRCSGGASSRVNTSGAGRFRNS